MREHKMFNINGEKLREALQQIGISLQKASIEIGYAPEYLSRSITNGRMRPSAQIALENRYNIKASDISIEKEDEAGAQETEAIDHDKLYKTIYAAVYEAVKKALND